MRRRDPNVRRVYSTDGGRVVRKNEKAPKPSHRPDGDGIVRIRRETKGRRGKTVTTIDGLTLGPDELKSLLRELKRACGSGGAVRESILEIQGDHRDAVERTLTAKGFTIRRAGG